MNDGRTRYKRCRGGGENDITGLRQPPPCSSWTAMNIWRFCCARASRLFYGCFWYRGSWRYVGPNSVLIFVRSRPKCQRQRLDPAVGARLRLHTRVTTYDRSRIEPPDPPWDPRLPEIAPAKLHRLTRSPAPSTRMPPPVHSRLAIPQLLTQPRSRRSIPWCWERRRRSGLARPPPPTARSPRQDAGEPRRSSPVRSPFQGGGVGRGDSGR